MPWTRQQVKYLLSKVSPLSDKQKTSMKSELHEDPSLGHRPMVNALTVKPKK